MLAQLAIRDLVTIASIDLAFGPGLTAITGDTGAGKSIILDALDLVLGGRADFGLMRAGASRTRVDARFAVAAELLEGLDVDVAEGDVVLSRELAAGNRSQARVQGLPAPLVSLRAVAERLVDVHGQSDHLSLLRADQQRDLLDRYAGAQRLRRDYATAYAQWQTLRERLDETRRAQRLGAQRIDFLRFQVEEIDAAALQTDEDLTLEAEHRRLVNVARLSAQLGAAYASLQDEGGAYDALARAARDIEVAAEFDPDAAPLADRLTATEDAVAEVAAEVRRLLERLEADPTRLAWVEERLARIAGLRRKYGGTVGEILATAAAAVRELDTLTLGEAGLSTLAAEVDAAGQTCGDAGWRLHEARTVAALTLERSVRRELDDLGLERTRLPVMLQTVPADDGVPTAAGRLAAAEHGLDTVAFQVAVNPGEPLRPLALAASGGEMARIMLALTAVLGSAAGTPVLVFDEVDAGVGGRSGDVVGRKLAQLACDHQVIAITHLPQVAAYADAHILVRKHQTDERTNTDCVTLDGEAVIGELASMLGRDSEATRQSARELVVAARLWKDSLSPIRS